MIRAVIFDVDGVILDSTQAIFTNFQETAKRLGVRVPADNEIRKLLGQPSSINLRILFGENPEARKIYDEVNKVTHSNLQLVPNAETALKQVKLKKAIVTSKRLASLKDQLKNHLNYFDAIVTPEDTVKQKPDPEPLLLACKRLGFPPKEVIYTGDALRDLETSRNAGIKFVAFVYTGATREEFSKAGADTIIDSLLDLNKIIKARNSEELKTTKTR
ncbi:MAG: HAD family hydrolase [Thaumarchaeota archaeon]|nr:HAD family hydrolase [Nitrososphaerota archaeon]